MAIKIVEGVRGRIASIAVASLMLGVPVVSAQPMEFSFQDAAVSISFDLDSNPTPINAFLFDFNVAISDATINGVSFPSLTTAGFESIPSGGFGIGNYSFAGPTLFLGGTGVRSSRGVQPPPVFAPGSFGLVDFTNNNIMGTLTITAVNPTATDVSAAPEPSTWALMIAAIGLIGVALRRPISRATF